MGPEADNSNIVVLAVDDEKENLELIQRAFRSQKEYKVISAASAEDALEILANEPIDVILVDHMMPSMLGVEFLERAKELAPDATNIMVTGYPDLKEVIKAINQGLIRHIVSKPYTIDELINVVKRALSLREMRSAVDTMKRPINNT